MRTRYGRIRLDAHPRSQPFLRYTTQGLTRRQRRTGEEGDVAPPEVAFLEVKVELRRRVLCDAVRIFSSLACRTEFERPANVNMRNEGIVSEFEALHRPSWKSRCQHHRGRPEMLQTTTIDRTLNRAAT